MISRAEFKRLQRLSKSKLKDVEPYLIRFGTIGYPVRVGKGGVKVGEYTIDGETYSWVTSTKSKSEAADIARGLKKKGEKARIVYTSDLQYNLRRKRQPAWAVLVKK